MKVDRNIFRLEHIIESITRIEILTENIVFDEFMADWMRQDAAVRNFQIIGEAVKNLDIWIIENNPHVAWAEIKGMRNILIHEYFGVAFDQLWKTIKEDLPAFKIEICNILKEIQSDKL